jgi:hypothetical protein
LQKGRGLLVRQVKVDSPADQLGLKRYDILLSCNGQAIVDADQLTTLFRAQKADRNVPLVLIRAGKQMTLEINSSHIKNIADLEDPRGSVKTGRPPEVTVKATTLGNGKMEVTFEFYPGGKLKQVTCTGTLDEIASQVNNLPMPVQDFAKVALNRLRTRKR